MCDANKQTNKQTNKNRTGYCKLTNQNLSSICKLKALSLLDMFSKFHNASQSRTIFHNKIPGCQALQRWSIEGAQAE